MLVRSHASYVLLSPSNSVIYSFTSIKWCRTVIFIHLSALYGRPVVPHIVLRPFKYSFCCSTVISLHNFLSNLFSPLLVASHLKHFFYVTFLLCSCIFASHRLCYCTLGTARGCGGSWYTWNTRTLGMVKLESILLCKFNGV